MKIFKYVSLFVFMLSGASCCGMKKNTPDYKIPLKCDAHDTQHTYKSLQHGYVETCVWICKNEKIGFLEAHVMDIHTQGDLERFYGYCMSGDTSGLSPEQKQETTPLLKGVKKIIMLNRFEIESAYQKQGLGRELLEYFVDYSTKIHKNALLCVKPVQCFTQIKGNVSHDTLQDCVERFYKRCGAQPIHGLRGWFSISLVDTTSNNSIFNHFACEIL